MLDNVAVIFWLSLFIEITWTETLSYWKKFSKGELQGFVTSSHFILESHIKY